MTIIGRTTKDAIVNQLPDERTVVNFTIAVNDYYKPKNQEEGVQLTTFINCSYWKNQRVAAHLSKGVVVELEGRIYAEAFISASGEAKASLKCHVNKIKLHGGGKKAGQRAAVNSEEATVKSDVELLTEEAPF